MRGLYLICLISIILRSLFCMCNETVGKQATGFDHSERPKSRSLGWLDMNDAWPFGSDKSDGGAQLLGGQSALHQSTNSLHTSASGKAGINLNGNSRQADGQMQQLINSNCIGQQGMLGTQKDINGDQNQNLHSMQQKVCLDGTIQQDFGHQNQQQGGDGDGLQQQAHKQELDLGSHKLTQVGGQQQLKSDGLGQQQQALLQGISEKQQSRNHNQHSPNNHVRGDSFNKPKPLYNNNNSNDNNNRRTSKPNTSFNNNGGSMFNGGGGSIFQNPDFGGFGQNPLFGDPYNSQKKNKPSDFNKPWSTGGGRPPYAYGRVDDNHNNMDNTPWNAHRYSHNKPTDSGRPPFAYGRVDDNYNMDGPPSRSGNRYSDHKKPSGSGHSTFPQHFPNMYPSNKKGNNFSGMPSMNMGNGGMGAFGPF